MIQPGSTLGDFELLDELGRGGMGVVYRARQVSLGREVAVKVLPSGAARQGSVARRFEAEARSMARLSHPAIASVHDGCRRERGWLPIRLGQDPLFAGLGDQASLWENHCEEVRKLPPDFVRIAANRGGAIQAMRHNTRLIYGV